MSPFLWPQISILYHKQLLSDICNDLRTNLLSNHADDT